MKTRFEIICNSHEINRIDIRAEKKKMNVNVNVTIIYQPV